MIKTILSVENYYDIFTKDNFKKEYLGMISKLHPDKCKDELASQAAAKLNMFYAEAKIASKHNAWKSSKQILTIDLEKSTIEIKYRYATKTEVGNMYVSDSLVTFTFNKEKFYKNFLDSLSFVSYKDENMKKYFSQFLPNVKRSFKDTHNIYYIILSKQKQVYPLSLVADIFSQKEHAAWVLTRLLNLCVLFQQNNFSHCGIDLNSCFVDLRSHGIYLLGGWQFATKHDNKLSATTKKIFDNLPPSIKASKISNPLIDIESTKFLVKELLKANSLMQLEKVCGKEMAQFLFSTINSSFVSLDELKRWEHARSKTFSKHEFVVIDAKTSESIYKKGC